MKRTILGGVGLALVTVALGAGARDRREAAGDGVVDRQEVCHGGSDLSEQPDLYRPHGGVLVMPPDATVAQVAAAQQAAAIRLHNSQGVAVWRVVRDTRPARVDTDQVVLASCHVGDFPNESDGVWSWAKPAGGLAIDWAAFAEPFGWPYALAYELRNLEGDAE